MTTHLGWGKYVRGAAFLVRHPPRFCSALYKIEFDKSLLVDAHEIHPDDLLALDDAMDKLYEEDRIAADLIKLRVFGGLTVDQAAEMLQISPSKAYVDLEYACAWLRLDIDRSETRSDS